MDSINSALSTSANDENSFNTESKRATFLSSYRRHQAWSLPDSIMYYITKTPSSSKCYQKMIQSCKYFFVQNPILVIELLNINYKTNKLVAYCNNKSITFNTVTNKFWITTQLTIMNDFNQPAQNPFSNILPKIYQSDIKRLSIYFHDLSVTNLQFLASKCENMLLHRLSVFDEDGSVVALEKFVETFTSLKKFLYDCPNNASNVISSKTVQELLKIPHFLNLDSFDLANVPASFDIDTFYSYMKANKTTKLHLAFRNPSIQYKAKLQEIVNEIIQTKNHEYKIPYIIFLGIDQTSFNRLLELINRV